MDEYLTSIRELEQQMVSDRDCRWSEGPRLRRGSLIALDLIARGLEHGCVISSPSVFGRRSKLKESRAFVFATLGEEGDLRNLAIQAL